MLSTLAHGLSTYCVPDLSEALGLEHSKVPVTRPHCCEPRGHRGGGRCLPVSAPALWATRPVLGWGKGRGGSPDVLGSPCVPGLTGPPPLPELSCVPPPRVVVPLQGAAAGPAPEGARGGAGGRVSLAPPWSQVWPLPAWCGASVPASAGGPARTQHPGLHPLRETSVCWEDLDNLLIFLLNVSG